MRRQLPNGLVVLRMILVPVIIAMVLRGEVNSAWLLPATLLTIAASVTDLLDGYLARRWDATTILGAFMDTTADKLLVSGVLLALIAVDRVSVWFAFAIIGRELLVMGLRGLAALDGTFIRPSIWGKIKATLQFIALPMAILRLDVQLAGAYLDEWVMALAALAALLSGWDYLRGFWQGRSAAAG